VIRVQIVGIIMLFILLVCNFEYEHHGVKSASKVMCNGWKPQWIFIGSTLV